MTNADSVPSMTELFPETEEDESKRNGRETASTLAETVRGQSVLVTGAGGSLGTALARRLSTLPVEQLLLLDTSEQGLIRLRERLEFSEADDGRSPGENGSSSPSLSYLLADLRVPPDRRRVLQRRPSIVIHAAAYKHVPFLEGRPIAAVQNNLLATTDWLRACAAWAFKLVRSLSSACLRSPKPLPQVWP